MIDHPCKGVKDASRLVFEAFDDIARGNQHWHSPKVINLLLRNGLILRRSIRRRKRKGFTTDDDAAQWILTPDAWAHWIEYERQRAEGYVEGEELQPPVTADRYEPA